MFGWFSKLLVNRPTSRNANNIGNISMAGNSSITVNGINYRGTNVVINNGSVIIDGVAQSTMGWQTVVINLDGNATEVSTASGTITVNGDATEVSTASGNVHVGGNVRGEVSTTSGDVTGTGFFGDVSTVSGNIDVKII